MSWKTIPRILPLALLILGVYFLLPERVLADETITTAPLDGEVNVFNGAAHQGQAGYPFTPSQDGYIGTAGLTVSAVISGGTPSDGMRAYIYSSTYQSSPTAIDVPGSLIATSDIVYPTGTCADYPVTLNTEVPVVNGTKYFVVWARVGSMDSSNTYATCGSEDSGAAVRYRPDAGYWDWLDNQFRAIIEITDEIPPPDYVQIFPTILEGHVVNFCAELPSGSMGFGSYYATFPSTANAGPGGIGGCPTGLDNWDLEFYTQDDQNGNYWTWFEISSVVYYATFTRIDFEEWEGEAPPPGEGTRIITVTPPNAETWATSTAFAFGATYYVSPQDFVSGMRLRIKARNNVAANTSAAGPSFSEGGNLVCSWLPDWLCPPPSGSSGTYQISGAGRYEYDIPVTSSGTSEFATTTDVQTIGRYTMFTELVRPNTGLFGSVSYSTFVSTTTHFIVATSSSYDLIVGSTTEAIVAAQQQIEPQCYFDILTPGNWLEGIRGCVTALFFVPTAYVASGLQGAMQEFLTHAPWGYATRVYVIVTSDTSSSTLPSIATEIPAGLPMAGSTFDFSPWEPSADALADLDTRVVPTMDGSPLDNFLFWWNTIWLIMFALWLLRELYGIAEMGDFDDIAERSGFAGGRAHGRIRRASNGQRYQEYTTADTKRLIKRGQRKGVIH